MNNREHEQKKGKIYCNNKMRERGEGVGWRARELEAVREEKRRGEGERDVGGGREKEKQYD